VNTVEPYGDAASLLQAIQAAGLGMKLGGGYVELTGKLTGKALVDLFQNPQFVAQLSLSETWQIRPLPGQGLSPDAAGALQQSAPDADPKGGK
jgi:hypothetical protein